VARRAGLRPDQLAAVRHGDGGPLDEPQRLALAYADAMTTGGAVPDELFAGLRAHFDDRRMVELTATVGTYQLVCRFVVALRIDVRDPPP
jgi:alkylhydroperoxidase family enzyme